MQTAYQLRYDKAMLRDIDCSKCSSGLLLLEQENSVKEESYA
jgi:transcription initiation factor IIE alpha subunit